MTMTIRLIQAKKLTLILATIVATLVVLSSIGQVSRFAFGYDYLKGFVPLFYVDLESNVPTWYSSFALLLASCLAGVHALLARARGDGRARYWIGLWLIFALLSVDEVAMIHEYPVNPLRRALHLGGALYYAWVIPGAVLVLAVGLAYLRFVLSQPPRLRNLIFLSAFVFVGGAIGVEMLTAVRVEAYGEGDPLYAVAATIEETFEMSGIVIFIHALMEHLHRLGATIVVRLGGDA